MYVFIVDKKMPYKEIMNSHVMYYSHLFVEMKHEINYLVH